MSEYVTIFCVSPNYFVGDYIPISPGISHPGGNMPHILDRLSSHRRAMAAELTPQQQFNWRSFMASWELAEFVKYFARISVNCGF